MMFAVAPDYPRARKTATHETMALDFKLPAALEAGEPPEARGLARDDVRLMVSYRSEPRIVHTRFCQIDALLRAGDVLVINTSGTRPAALPATDARGHALSLHLSTQLPAGLWLVELRRPQGAASQPYFAGQAGDELALPSGGSATLHRPHGARKRLWLASISLPQDVDAYLERHGQPIRYPYVSQAWPIDYYQTVYATEPGSAEMPSAGRPFTAELLTRLVSRGVHVAPVILHTGVASLEADEPPYEEYYRVPATTARLINVVRGSRSLASRVGETGRVIAVGTTVVRALETVVDDAGEVHPGQGWTDLVVEADRELRAVDGLLTGLHEPRASHLAVLKALAGADHVRRTYDEALRQQYLWHEFGDLHLILP